MGQNCLLCGERSQRVLASVERRHVLGYPNQIQDAMDLWARRRQSKAAIKGELEGTHELGNAGGVDESAMLEVDDQRGLQSDGLVELLFELILAREIELPSTARIAT
jgi:hypothetical protein